MKIIQAGEAEANTVRINNKFRDFRKLTKNLCSISKVNLNNIKFEAQKLEKVKNKYVKLVGKNGEVLNQNVRKEDREHGSKDFSGSKFFNYKSAYLKAYTGFTITINELKINPKSSKNIYTVRSPQKMCTVTEMNEISVAKLSKREYGEMMDDLEHVMLSQCHYSPSNGSIVCNI